MHITLTGLGPNDVTDWVTARIGQAPDPALVAHLTDTSGGNPFYLRELIALLESDGRLGGGFDSVPAGVPHAVQDVVRRRTSRLPPETQALLTVAAVIGRHFDVDLLAGVLEVDPAETLRRLEPALDDGLVEADDSNPSGLAFSHALVSSTLAAELNAARLAAYHARTASVLETLRADDLEPWVEELAHHAAEGLLTGTAPRALTLLASCGGGRRCRAVLRRCGRAAPAGVGGGKPAARLSDRRPTTDSPATRNRVT